MTQGSLAVRLRVLRAERGLTLRQAAAKTGVTKETISDLEKGLRHPHDPTLGKIAKGYGVPIEELIEEQPAPLGEAQPPGRPAAEDKDHDPTEKVRKQLFNPDLDPLEQSIIERAGEHVRRWSERADLLEKIEAKGQGAAYSLVVNDRDAVKEDTKLLLRDMMAHLDRAGAEPLTGVWLKLGREVADVTDRVLAVAERLKEEPEEEVEIEEPPASQYENVIYGAFQRTGRSAFRRSTG